MPKRSHFSGLGNRRLRCVRSIVSGAKPLSLKCLIRTLIQIEAFQKIFMGYSPFAKMPKMSHFSGLGNRQLRCVRNIVSGAKPRSLKCLIRTFISSNFQ